MICIGPTYVCDLVYVCDLHGIYLAFHHVSLIFNLHARGSGKKVKFVLGCNVAVPYPTYKIKERMLSSLVVLVAEALYAVLCWLDECTSRRSSTLLSTSSHLHLLWEGGENPPRPPLRANAGRAEGPPWCVSLEQPSHLII